MNQTRNTAVGPQIRERGRGRRRWPQAVIASLALLLGLWAATEYFAYQFGYQPALGGHFRRVYAPWSILLWADQWSQQYPEALMRAGSIGLLVAGVGLIALLFHQMIAANTARGNEFLHGSARWADRKDIEAAGLFHAEGVYVGA